MTLQKRHMLRRKLKRIGPPMTKADETNPCCFGAGSRSRAMGTADWRLDRLIDRLPDRLRSTVHWLRQPRSIGIRIPAGVLLTCGGLFGFLPVLGFWMLPVGLALLADDVPPLRAVRSRTLDWIERRHLNWLASPAA